MNIRYELAQIVDDVAEQATREGRIASPLDVVDAILARYGVVELPEETPADKSDDPSVFQGSLGEYWSEDGLIVGNFYPFTVGTPGQARAEAAAILAAANRAEGKS